MHPRHRSPGNGYRSTSMGVGGIAAASRISPEGSIRGHGVYNSEYRNYNRGFGRGQSKPFQPPQPPPRRGDVFMEAGRLATEYLVSKGLLPPNVLSGKWQNGSLKNQMGDFQGFRPQEGEGLHFPLEGRTSALARLGNAGPDVGFGRRRFSDEYNQAGSRNSMRGRRRTGSFKNYGSEWNRDIGRSGLWSDKARASPEVEGYDDTFSGYQEEQVGKDGSGGGPPKSRPSELAPKSDSAGDSEFALEKFHLPDDAASKASSSSSGKDLPSEADVEPSEKSDGMKFSNAGTGEMKDDGGTGDMEKQNSIEDIPIQHRAEDDDPASKNGSDLLRLCRFAKVPTKTRSSLTGRGSKVDPIPTSEDENSHHSGLPRVSVAPIEDISVDGSSGDAPSNQCQIPKCLVSDISKAPTVEDAGELGLVCTVGQGKCTRSRSFPDKSFMNEQDSSEGPPGFGRSNSMVMEGGEKRAAEQSYIREVTKRPREWAPLIDSQGNDYVHVSNSREKQQNSQEGRNSPGEELILTADQKGSMDGSLFPKGGAETCIEYAEEKPLFPGSFKICDLNLMEASDLNENHDVEPILIYPSVPKSKQEAAPVDIDLSMSNNCNLSDKYTTRGADGKEVEVIDLENDAAQEEDKAFNNSERKAQTVFTDLVSFPNNAQNVNDIPDVQDGYGLMISELLGNDIPNCSSVPADINSLHNEIGLHSGEGILGDDDSIYMSLGEIPISFVRVWE